MVGFGFGGSVGGGVHHEPLPAMAVAVPPGPVDADAHASAGAAAAPAGAPRSQARVRVARARVTGAVRPLEDPGTMEIMARAPPRAGASGRPIVRTWERPYAGSRAPGRARAAPHPFPYRRKDF
ncbi:hypothetical protein GCM10010349_74090 [Streptomyces flavofungini]|nr:hypothetical protein GCM10010349_74090 [Streptomyces flavofungini]